ncbi:MAG: hypothetical protein QOF37_589 [Thermoleophilaceae bacterium]|nr:hypothetical protein [Thermoleophilaceae bacterium]
MVQRFMSISTEISPVDPRSAPRRAPVSREARYRAAERAARRRSAARTDLIVAAAAVLLAVPTGLIGLAIAAMGAMALLTIRAAWLWAAAVRRRRASQPLAVARPPRRRWPSPQMRVMRTATIAALLTLILASISFAQALTARSDSALPIRAVEWARDNGAQSLVSSVEGFYYTLTAPGTGGPGLKRLPGAGVAGSSADARLGPPDIPPAIHPRLPGEGVWHPTQLRYSRADAPVLVTTLRPDPNYPRVVAGVASINPRRASIALYPGLKEPGGGIGPAEVPAADRSHLLATFNSGFKHADSHGGFYAAGRLFQPLTPGQGTIVGNTDGSVDVRAWTGGSRPGPGISFARQNLPLIVAGGQPNPALGDSSKWGVTLGNSVLVWRSGVGVDRHGNLIYAAANYQSARSLARLLIRAGAVRAVQLDINSYWVSFNLFRGAGGLAPEKLLKDSTRSATRYLTQDDRDFFAVYSR